MILVGGENLIDFVQTDAPDGRFCTKPFQAVLVTTAR